MTEVELEFTYLARELPAGLADCPSKIIADVFYPASEPHPILRVRHNGDTYQITKKSIAHGTDSSHMIEETINLTPEEWQGLTASPGKRFTKRRFRYHYQGRMAEIDVYQEALRGLVVVDFEFTNREEQLAFKMPAFCLADITQEEQLAGGMLAGKTYHDIEDTLHKYGYKALYLD